jgi:hypothetical protein
MEGAKRHGIESDPDHEVGDLQDMLVACWATMGPEERLRAMKHPRFAELLEGEYLDIMTEEATR